MARTTRTRTRANATFVGSAVASKGGTVVSTTNVSRVTPADSITDSTGRPVVPSPLSSSQYSGIHPYIAGYIRPQLTTLMDRVDFNTFYMSPLPTAITSLSTLGVPAGWTLDLVAGTNPSRPIVTIPELVEDIADLPRMLKNLGDILRSPSNLASNKGLAGQYLGIQFGWLPLLEDLHKLLNFQDYVNKRNKELAQLYSGRGLRRRLTFSDSTETTSVTTQNVWSNSFVSQYNSLTIRKRQWATIRWKPLTPPPYHPDDESRNAFTRRILLGATPEGLAKGLWAVIPWTWLIGWFSNFGKYTLAHSWTVPAQYKDMCFMSEAVATYRGGGVSATATKDQQLQGFGNLTRTLKTRVVSSTVSSSGFNMPYLDMFRLSILGSLFVQRFAGR